MKWLVIGVGLTYGLLSNHYVAQGLRTKIESVGWQVVRELLNRRRVII